MEHFLCARYHTNCFMNITTHNADNILVKEGIVFAVLKMRKLGFLALGHFPGTGNNWRSPDLNQGIPSFRTHAFSRMFCCLHKIQSDPFLKLCAYCRGTFILTPQVMIQVSLSMISSGQMPRTSWDSPGCTFWH